MAGIPKQITAWSYSRLQTYEACPYKAKLSYIDKVPTKQGPAMARGSEIHKKAEDFIMGKLPRLPKELVNYKDDFAKAKKAAKDSEVEVFVEQQWGLARDWSETSWFGRDTWGRVVVDYGVHYDDFIRLVDHKTGKQYENHREQLEPYAIAGLHRFPNAEAVSAEMWYLDHDQATIPKLEIEFTRSDLPKLEKKWEAKIKPMLADKRFAPRPGSACRFCDFSAAKGGPCRF